MVLNSSMILSAGKTSQQRDAHTFSTFEDSEDNPQGASTISTDEKVLAAGDSMKLKN